MSEVYRPSEDTFLLLDVLGEVGRGFRRVVDVGSGSGEVSKRLAELSEEVHSTDISPEAARATLQALRESGVSGRAHVVCCDTLSAYRDGGLFDLVASNPPYLEPEGVGDVAVEGGRSLLSSLIREASRRIKRGGKLVFVASSHTKGLEELLAEAREAGFEARVVRKRRLFFEELMVIMAEYVKP